MTNIMREVYIKFGAYHGTKGLIIGETEKNGYPAFYIQVANDKAIVKKQKNTVFVGGIQKCD